MIHYLMDSTALWRIQRDQELRTAWEEVISCGAVGSCHPQRVKFKCSARNRIEYDDMTDMFNELYPDVPVPKSAWHWIDSLQYRLSERGEHRGLSVVDLLISATAAYRGLTVLHDDDDFVTVVRATPDLRERNIHTIPPAEHDAET